MKVEVTMPEEYMGDVIGSLNAKRGQIERYGRYRWWKDCYVHSFHLLRCSVTLQSFVPSTQGRGNYSMFFEKYEQCPKNVQEKVLAN